ncbi:MAG: aminotransferase class III-fold pyridoxal phosphate-dependent enzyme [Caldilineaceae bacterium]
MQQRIGTAAPGSNGTAANRHSAYDHELYNTALDHVWIHSTNYVELAEQQGMHVFERGEGCLLYDARGEAWIDGIAGLWVVNAGHGRQEIAQAMADQASKLAYVSASSYTSVPAVQLAETLAQLTPGDLQRVFCSGGSEAVESAIKIAKQVQVLRGFPKRYKIIAARLLSRHDLGRHEDCHRRTCRTQMERFFGPMMPGVYHVPSPNHYRNDFGLAGEEGDLMCANWVEQEIIFQGAETVAAVIGEPISSANGLHVPSPQYWQRLREICDRHGVLLIMDEVINGFGRTGTWFATEHFGVVPDIMTMAKGLSSGYARLPQRLCGRVYTNLLWKAALLSHLLTFGGQAVAAAAALKNIEILHREALPQRSAEMGTYLLQSLQQLADNHPTVGDARGQGLYCALELVKDKATKEKMERDSDFVKRLNQEIAKRRLLTRVWNIVHIAPPLVVTRAEVDRIVTILDESLTVAELEYGFA